MKKNIFTLFIILLFYVGIPLIIYFNIINFKYRFIVLTVFGIVLYILARLLKYSNKDLGITTNNLKKSLIRILPITLVGIIFTLVCVLVGYNKFTNSHTLWFYLFYVIISCPIQELLYRGILNSFLNNYRLNSLIRMIICSLLFCFIHVIYKNVFTLIITFVIGMYWQYNYDKDKCLLGVVFSHVVLGIITIVLGVID